MSPPGVDALVFDVQGTLLDFFTPVHRALAEALESRRLDADAASLTRAWRRSYSTGMEPVTAGQRAYVPSSTIYREGLDGVLAGAGIDAHFSAAERDALIEAWTHLVPWPDTVDGLRRLRRGHLLVTLTNGGMAATIALAARHDLAFHAILSTDLVRTFKPAPETYRLALDCLGRPSERVMMVASHPYDLEAARLAGMRTAFIDRPLEFGPDVPNQSTAPDGTDLSAVDVLDLATQLGAASSD